MQKSNGVAKHRQLSEQAYQYISAGIDAEQRNDTAALGYFIQGASYLNQALGMSFPGQDSSQVQLLNQKMRNNLNQVRERIDILARKKQSQRLSTPPRKPATSTSDPLKNKILDEMVVEKPSVTWEQIIGLEQAKRMLREIVVLPYLRPDLFTGLRQPAKGVLLFGPPGTGKTMLAKAVAHEAQTTFFSISASTLTSKYFGEGEKMVKSLFETARSMQPSIIFIDEIDSILTARSESEHEASRRLKTEFLLQFDGLGTESDRILVLAATNRPQELDEAALRRLVKRVYIPLPEGDTRHALVSHLLKGQNHSLSTKDMNQLMELTKGYSGSDLTALAREASLGPLRELGDKVMTIPSNQVRGISLKDFRQAMQVIRPSVNPSSIQQYEDWNRVMGTSG